MATETNKEKKMALPIRKSEFTAVRLHRDTTALKLNELSEKRKKERSSIKSAQDIVEQLINQAHKRECK